MMTPAMWAALPQVERDRLQRTALARYRREALIPARRLEIAADILHPTRPAEPITRCRDCGAWLYRRRPCTNPHTMPQESAA